MKSWIKSVFAGFIGVLWFAILISIALVDIKSDIKVFLILAILLISIATALFFYLLYHTVAKQNKILNEYANKDRHTFLFEMDYKKGLVSIYNNDLSDDKTMKIKSFAKKYLGIAEDSKEYVALILGKLDFDFYHKQCIKIVENRREKYYHFRCLLTKKNKLYGCISQTEE